MKVSGAPQGSIVQRKSRGYLLVLGVIAVAFVAVAAAMQVVVLTSVATTSRAYDSYRQGAAEAVRLRRAVAESLMDVREIAVPAGPRALSDALTCRLGQLGCGTGVAVTRMPESLPAVVTFPDAASAPDMLSAATDAIRPWLSPELGLLVGVNFAAYPEVEFEFQSQRTVLDINRTYGTRVQARMFAVPLTRFAVCAYELPSEIAASGPVGNGPPAVNPVGLAPARDGAFVPDLQASATALPYAYRARTALATAYQYVFSDAFVQRVTEYAGVTHFCQLDAGGPTATLDGMSRSGVSATWDLGVAGKGTFGAVNATRDAAVVFTETAGAVLRLSDSVGSATAAPLLLVVLGPSDPAKGSLIVELAPIARPVVLIACNVQVTAAAGVSVNGALFLDPTCSLLAQGPLTVGHLSYWAGSTRIPNSSIVTSSLAPAAELIAPRVVYVATKAYRR